MKLLHILIFILLFHSLIAQNLFDKGSFLIHNYTPDEYKASTQVFALAQDSRGVLFLGNMNGVIEFDGNNWSIHELSNKSLPQALAADKNGKIFIGATNEIGYLSSDEKGSSKYQSLVHFLPESERNFNDVIKTLVTSKGVYFVLEKTVFHYNYDTIHVYKPDLSSVWAYAVMDNLILVNRNAGIHLFRNGEIVLLPHSKKIIENNGIYEIIEYNDEEILIMTEQGGLVRYNLQNILKTIDENNKIRYDFEYDELITRIPTNVDKYLAENRLTVGAKVNDNLFAFGTVRGGVIFIDDNGNFEGIVNKNRGLNDNAVSEILVDANNDVWIGLNYGLSHVQVNTPIRKYEEIYGLDDAVLSTIEFEGKRYFGTMNGIFTFPDFNINNIKDAPVLKRVHDIKFSAWDFINFNGNLFTTGDLGIYQIKKSKGKGLVADVKPYVFESCKKFDDHMLVGLVSGLRLVKVKNRSGDFAKIEIINNFDEINSAVRAIHNDKHGNVWITSQFNSVYYIRFGENPKDYELFKFDTIHGIPNPNFNYIHEIDNKILVSTENGLYKYTGPEIIHKLEDSVKYFVPDSAFLFFTKTDSLLPNEIHTINDSTYWLQTDYTIGKLQFQKDSLLWNDSVSKIIPPAYYTFYDKDGTLWVCADRGIIRFNTKNIPTLNSFNTLIRKVLVNQDSLVFDGYNCRITASDYECYQNINDLKHIVSEFEFDFNSLEFQFSSTFYQEKDKVLYSYKLDGYDEKWSAWSTERKKEYTNLNEGDYTFYVKAKNIYEKRSNIAQYSFEINPPWYRTIVAYLVYLIILGILFYIGIRLNSQRLKAANIRLEKIVRSRTEEIRKQKDELEKLSIVASETDNAVIIMDARGNIEWVNDGFTRMYGYTQDELVQVKGKNIVNTSSNVYIKEVLNSVVHNKESIIYESMFVSKEGFNVWVQTTLTPIMNTSGNVIKLVAIDTDIGKLKTAEEEISQQKEELQTQSELLEETNIELERTNLLITDSIKYAKLIQDAILPSGEEIRTEFPESFIFYQPKSIVSGDFYWIARNNDKVFIAVVDCTGHGVPGAFMSLIGSILLNEIINDKQILSPANILDRLNSGVINALGQTGKRDEIQDDGMDMTLLVIDKNKKKMNVALANHNVYLFKGNEQITVEGDIFSIGGVLSRNVDIKFENHEFDIENGDAIYMFSDGFQDQFGGEEGKKYMATRFKNFINQIHSFSMQIQEHKVKNEFKSWQGHEKQVDDVLVMGLKFTDL